MTHLRQSSRTNAEKRLADGLRRRKFSFKQNQIIEGFEVDFWFPDCGLVVEVDGYTHLSGVQQHLDQKKDQSLIEKGFIVIRINNQQIRDDFGNCLLEIESITKKLKSLKNNLPINDQWKETLKKVRFAKEEPREVIKTLEEYFLSIEKNRIE